MFMIQSQQRMEVEAKRDDMFQTNLQAMMGCNNKPKVLRTCRTRYHSPQNLISYVKKLAYKNGGL
jgi:hypothetical protein